MASRRSEIQRLIGESPVCVIKGETGCGKTTQVVQYILEGAAEEGRAADAAVVVTQPRRISAITGQ